MVIIVPNIISAASELQANVFAAFESAWFSVRGEICVPIISILTLILLLLIIMVLLAHRKNMRLLMLIRVDMPHLHTNKFMSRQQVGKCSIYFQNSGYLQYIHMFTVLARASILLLHLFLKTVKCGKSLRLGNMDCT